jgi:hypothetical protein
MRAVCLKCRKTVDIYGQTAVRRTFQENTDLQLAGRHTKDGSTLMFPRHACYLINNNFRTSDYSIYIFVHMNLAEIRLNVVETCVSVFICLIFNDNKFVFTMFSTVYYYTCR